MKTDFLLYSTHYFLLQTLMIGDLYSKINAVDFFVLSSLLCLKREFCC